MGATHRYLAAYVPAGAPPAPPELTLISSSQVVFGILAMISGGLIALLAYRCSAAGSGVSDLAH